MRRAVLAAALACFAPASAWADGLALAVSGHLAHPRSFSADDLAKLPQVTAEQSSGAQLGGVLLWKLLDDAGWVDQPGRKTHLQHVILARGQDGYTVALSIAELDPAFEGKPVLVVTSRDGKPAPSLELFVPGDKKAGRHVHELVAVEVE